MNFTKLFANSTKAWLELIEEAGLEDLQSILDKIQTQDGKQFAPNVENIFEFTKYTPKDIKICILGMDPYPTPGDAHGLAFSTKNKECPVSLNRIFLNLLKSGLIKKKPEIFDLSYLSIQGVLLLNTALTVELKKPGSHILLWKKWMETLIQLVVKKYPPKYVCLWGNDAKRFKPIFETNPSIVILESCHPVAMISPSFSDCDHFQIISKSFPQLIFDPHTCDTVFFTDGSSKNNQKPELARAASGVICQSGLFIGKKFGCPISKVQVKYKNQMIDAFPSNIRAEGTALLLCMKIINTMPNWIKATVKTDSEFWIDMLTTYIPTWIERGTPFTEKKNADIAEDLWKIWNIVKSRTTLGFVPAWHNRKTEPITDEEKSNYLGNKFAEEAAESYLL